jgi:tetratricopeptide (TPR) repeat protein
MPARATPSAAAIQLGRALRSRREAWPATRAQTAERLGYSVDRVRQVETGSYPPGVEYMARWAEIFGELDSSLRALWDGLLAEQRDQRGGISPDDAARLLAALAEPRRTDVEIVRHFEQALGAQRAASRLLRPSDLVEALTPSYELMGHFRRDAKPGVRRELLRLRSEYAQFIGRMHHDAGNHAEACRWSDASLRAATQARDGTLVAFTLARRTSLAAAEGDAAEVLDLARAARAPAGLPAEISTLSLRCEAHGHAMAGDADDCRRALDQSAELVGKATGGLGYASGYSMSFHLVQAAGCLARLGRTEEAIQLYERELPSFAPSREQALNLARLASAYATEGERDRAGRAACRALAIARRTGAVRAAWQLRRAGLLDEAVDILEATAT